MPGKAQDDDLVMNLVELALARPAGEREPYVRDACGGDAGLFEQVWHYVEWEERMNGFLLEPFYPASSSEEHPFEPGELLDERFRIIREVAQGGMGVVYEATDEKLDRRVALKCAKAGFRNRLPPEVRHATTISHPNVCRIFEIHTAATRQGNVDFLTMEFLDGETLADRILRAPVSDKEARILALQLCAGLAEAHRNGVIHGDLKSNNVFLCGPPGGEVRAVITDFGLARRPEAAQRAMQSGQLGGTPDYMAPELLNGEKATVVSDIYALGVILHELIYGCRPGAQEKAGTHARWDRTLARCLDPDPAKRFRSAGEIAEALAPRSRRWVLAAAVAGLVATVGWVSYERALTPRESITLALLPLEAETGAAPVAAGVSREVSAQLERLKGGSRATLSVIKFTDVTRRKAGSIAAARNVLGATYVVRGTLRNDFGVLVLHAFVTDTRTQADLGEREFLYAADELRYAPRALAALVTSTLHLPPLPATGVNASAKKEYEAGLAFTRRNSTIDRALPVLESAVKADADSPFVWAALAEAQWAKYFITKDKAWLGRTTESIREAQRRDLDVAAVHRVAGLPLANDGFFEKAEAEYLRAIELDPGNSDGYRRLGGVYDSNNQLVQALAAYRKAVELEPTYFKVYQDLGSYYVHRGNSREAIQQFERCVQLAPDESEAHYVLGSAYFSAGRFVDAERELRAAIALGESARALNNLAAALMYQGKDGEAVPVLVHALERYPERYLSWLNLGDAYRRTSQRAESARSYRRGLAMADKEMARNPKDAVVRSRLAYLSARLGDRKRAESETEQALKMSPEATNARDTAVWTYEALEERDKALEVLSTSSDQVLLEVLRRSDLADLCRDSRFQQLLASRQLK